MKDNSHIIEVENLYMYFPVTAGVFQKRIADVKAVDGMSFYIKKGETLGLAGESGCNAFKYGNASLPGLSQ